MLGCCRSVEVAWWNGIREPDPIVRDEEPVAVSFHKCGVNNQHNRRSAPTSNSPRRRFVGTEVNMVPLHRQQALPFNAREIRWDGAVVQAAWRLLRTQQWFDAGQAVSLGRADAIAFQYEALLVALPHHLLELVARGRRSSPAQSLQELVNVAPTMSIQVDAGCVRSMPQDARDVLAKGGQIHPGMIPQPCRIALPMRGR